MFRKGSLSTMLSRRVELWRNVPAAVPDKLGTRPMVATKIQDLHAAVIPQTGGILAGRTGETKLVRTTHKVVIRYRDDIRPSDWIVFRGQRLDILYILDADMNRERLELFCEALI